MDSEDSKKLTPKDAIIACLSTKSQLKSETFDVCLNVFNEIKDVLGEISNDLNELLPDNLHRRIRLVYSDRGKFEAEIKFADDVLVFSMHTDIFQFDRNHPIWKNNYVKKDSNRAYCGIISVYNFLTDSMKYNRTQDLGYLVARVFINKDRYFFVEGKRQKKQRTEIFGNEKLTRESIISIVESAILYTLSFDLLAPPFDLVKELSIEQMKAKIDFANTKTGKRLGFRYNSDDVLARHDD